MFSTHVSQIVAIFSFFFFPLFLVYAPLFFRLVKNMEGGLQTPSTLPRDAPYLILPLATGLIGLMQNYAQNMGMDSSIVTMVVEQAFACAGR